jgi:predicted lipid-binding transport protein (Tim44 family)
VGGVARPPDDLERLVRAALGGLAAALAMGLVASEYVGAGLFAYLTPLVLGVLTGEAAQRAAAAPRRGPLALGVRGLAALLSVLGTALGFVVEGSAAPWSGQAVLPYAAAVLGAVVWTAPPGRPGRYI